MVKPQKAQQEEKRLVCPLQEKAQEYSGMQSIPPRGTALEEKGWKTRQKMVTFVKYSRCNYKGTKTEKNQEQDFVSGEKLKNIWCENCLEIWKWRNNETGSRVKCTKSGKKDTIVGKKILEEKRKNIWYPKCRTGKK